MGYVGLHLGRLLGCLVTLLWCLVVMALPVVAEPNATIDLKLFEKSEVDRSKGCTVVLWQDDRDPEADKFAYLFAETLVDKKHTRQPARMKIGKTVTTLTRVATGGKTTGYDLYEYQLYRMPTPGEFVVMDLKLAEEEGESVDVISGTVILIMKGKPVFRATVKGNAGCMTPAAVAPARKPAPAPTAGAAKSASSPPKNALAACEAAAEKANEPTNFACDWKKAIALAPGFSLTGKYTIVEKGHSGVMTIIETGDGPAQIGITTVAKTPNSPTCSVGLGASRDDKDRLTATMDDPKNCIVRVVSVPGPNIVKVTATEACSTFCGLGAAFDGKWQLQEK